MAGIDGIAGITGMAGITGIGGIGGTTTVDRDCAAAGSDSAAANKVVRNVRVVSMVF